MTKKETPQKDNESDSEVVVPRKGGKENRYNSEKEEIDFINPSCKVMKHDPHEPRFCKSGFIKWNLTHVLGINIYIDTYHLA